MRTRRNVLIALAGLGLAGGSFAAGSYGEAVEQGDVRLARQSELIDTSAGTLEYAVVGGGPPLLMIHGTGGGFDQGLLFAHGLRQRNFQIIAPSRFGYLRSTFPEDASPAHQADVLVELLDHIGIETLPVVGGSAGALTAAQFALRHPDRCSHLVLLVPAANLSGRDPVVFTALQQLAVDAVLGSDWWFWALSRLARQQMIGTLLATDPALLEQVVPEERRRAELILAQIFPISRKVNGLRTDGFWAGAASPTPYERIVVPTLILSCEDDRFGTAETSRLLNDRIEGSRLKIYPSGGHIWLGHDNDVADEVTAFIYASASSR